MLDEQSCLYQNLYIYWMTPYWFWLIFFFYIVHFVPSQSIMVLVSSGSFEVVSFQGQCGFNHSLMNSAGSSFNFQELVLWFLDLTLSWVVNPASPQLTWAHWFFLLCISCCDQKDGSKKRKITRRWQGRQGKKVVNETWKFNVIIKKALSSQSVLSILWGQPRRAGSCRRAVHWCGSPCQSSLDNLTQLQLGAQEWSCQNFPSWSDIHL